MANYNYKIEQKNGMSTTLITSGTMSSTSFSYNFPSTDYQKDFKITIADDKGCSATYDLTQHRCRDCELAREGDHTHYIDVSNLSSFNSKYGFMIDFYYPIRLRQIEGTNEINRDYTLSAWFKYIPDYYNAARGTWTLYVSNGISASQELNGRVSNSFDDGSAWADNGILNLQYTGQTSSIYVGQDCQRPYFDIVEQGYEMRIDYGTDYNFYNAVRLYIVESDISTEGEYTLYFETPNTSNSVKMHVTVSFYVTPSGETGFGINFDSVEIAKYFGLY